MNTCSLILVRIRRDNTLPFCRVCLSLPLGLLLCTAVTHGECPAGLRLGMAATQILLLSQLARIEVQRDLQDELLVQRP